MISITPCSLVNRIRLNTKIARAAQAVDLEFLKLEDIRNKLIVEEDSQLPEAFRDNNHLQAVGFRRHTRDMHLQRERYQRSPVLQLSCKWSLIILHQRYRWRVPGPPVQMQTEVSAMAWVSTFCRVFRSICIQLILTANDRSQWYSNDSARRYTYHHG